MRNMYYSIIFLLSTAIIIVMPGCIHTFPDNEGSAPSLVQGGIDVNFNINWETNEVTFTKAKDTGCRLTIEMTRNNDVVGRCQHYLSAEDYSKGNVRLILPFKLHAVSYKISAWLDFVDDGDNQKFFYDITSFSDVRRTDNHISWSDNMGCATYNTTVNLQQYKDQWGAKAVIPINMTTPLARFQIVATDSGKFRQFIGEALKRGETYSICLSFENRVARGFDAYENEISGYLESPEYYFPFPETGDIVACGALMADAEEIFIKVKVLVYNSARIIVSKSPPIKFPVQRGKLTLIRGDMLTDFYNNSINVNNIWDGEIVIEI